MSLQLSHNCLRRVRRRTGLTQEEVAFLIGETLDCTKVSQHEAFCRLPSTSAIFAYEMIFGTSARELFAGPYEDVRQSVVRRARMLIRDLSENPDDSLTRSKVQYLKAIVEAKEHQPLP